MKKRPDVSGLFVSTQARQAGLNDQGSLLLFTTQAEM
jgi:hypothetical protein